MPGVSGLQIVARTLAGGICDTCVSAHKQFLVRVRLGVELLPNEIGGRIPTLERGPEFVDWTAERAFPGRAGWAQQILLDAAYKLWSLPDFLKGADPLRAPITKGAAELVALP
jgi:hypothetical protein